MCVDQLLVNVRRTNSLLGEQQEELLNIFTTLSGGQAITPTKAHGMFSILENH